MISRRNFLQFGAKAGIASATAPLWMHLTSSKAFGQVSGSYKAIVLVTMPGGNDGNNTVIPYDSSEYQQYASLRSRTLALRQDQLIPLSSRNGGATYGLHPSLQNVATLYDQGQAAVVANVGTLLVPVTKQQISQDRSVMPSGLLSHPSSLAQWESSSASVAPKTGWGGRIADVISSQSGSLPPILDVGIESIFTVGRSVQAVAVQASTGTFAALPGGMESVVAAIAQNDAASQNQIVAQAAQMRVAATAEQLILTQAQNAGSGLKTSFPSTGFGNAMKTIAQLINGRSVVGASRQIFYCNQGFYDFHQNQTWSHAQNLAEFDAGIGAFMQALNEMGLANQVLLCTHSDFGRTMQANSTGGTDHAWGNHQFVIGGGISGGQIYGTMPALELGGSSDLGNQGIWIPTTAVTQMTAGVGAWMGLSSSQISTIFPDLANFPAGALAFSSGQTVTPAAAPVAAAVVAVATPTETLTASASPADAPQLSSSTTDSTSMPSSQTDMSSSAGSTVDTSSPAASSTTTSTSATMPASSTDTSSGTPSTNSTGMTTSQTSTPTASVSTDMTTTSTAQPTTTTTMVPTGQTTSVSSGTQAAITTPDTTSSGTSTSSSGSSSAGTVSPPPTDSKGTSGAGTTTSGSASGEKHGQGSERSTIKAGNSANGHH